MKSNIMSLSHKVSVILFLMFIVGIFQSQTHAQDLSAAQKEVWEMAETYWNTWKEKSARALDHFYHKDYVYWGAESIWPDRHVVGDPPSGARDGLDELIDSFALSLHQVKVVDNIAVVMYESKVMFLGRPYRFRCTDLWINQANKWQLIGTMRDSCSKLPNCP